MSLVTINETSVKGVSLTRVPCHSGTWTSTTEIHSSLARMREGAMAPLFYNEVDVRVRVSRSFALVTDWILQNRIVSKWVGDLES